jgi:hypothetical protein
MKRLFSSLALGTAAILAPLYAQDLIKSIDWEKLAPKAKETVNVTLDGSMLKLASGFLSANDPDQSNAKELISGLNGIYVRSLKFDKPGEYSFAEIEKAVSTLKGTKWNKIVDVNGKDEKSGVYIQSNGQKILGLIVVAAEPTELTVVNIDGAIDPARVRELSGKFGIPKIDIDTKKSLKK